MHKLLLVILLLVSTVTKATNYYVDSTGNDANNGTSTATPWKTITKVNSFFASLLPGDSVLFKRGHTFYGKIVTNAITNNGVAGTALNNIVLGSYGTGTDAYISGMVTVSGWQSVGSGIYKAYCPQPSYLNNVLTLDGYPQQMARWPNSSFNSYSVRLGGIWIIDTHLPDLPDWGTGKMYIRKNRYISETDSVIRTGQDTIHYISKSPPLTPPANWGYFMINHIAALDTAGEWFYDHRKDTMYYHFGALTPSEHVVKTAAIDTLVYIAGHGTSYITFDHLVFEGAASEAFYANASPYITVKNCTFINNGRAVVDIFTSDYFNINHCTLNNNNATKASIMVHSTCHYAYVGYNNVKNSGVLLGMSGSGQESGSGIWSSGDRTTVEYNNVDSSAYDGIMVSEDSVTVRNNYVNHSCLYRDDGGGIYAIGDSWANRSYITNNIVLNSKGTNQGTNGTNQPPANGIYLDNDASNYTVTGNTVANCYGGVFMHNNHSVVVRSNNLFDNQYGLLFQQGASSHDSVRNNIVSKNVFAPSTFYKRADSLYSNTNDVALFQSADSNYFVIPSTIPFPFKTKYSTVASIHFIIDDWRITYGWDINSPAVYNNTAMLVYNETAIAATKTFSGTYKDVQGNFFTGSIVLQPYTSAILYQTPDLPPPPPEIRRVFFKVKFGAP